MHTLNKDKRDMKMNMLAAYRNYCLFAKEEKGGKL